MVAGGHALAHALWQAGMRLGMHSGTCEQAGMAGDAGEHAWHDVHVSMQAQQRLKA